ncbi:MAG: hypothetical protein GF333_04435 [Candidatus Omnitrophica bacterium]|nr:hypothetical protein [Candidatus Omnitrophota bacterium]
MSEYAVILFVFFLFPVTLSAYPPLRLYARIRAVAVTIGKVLLLWGAWEVFAVFRGYWRYREITVFPWRFFNLPAEALARIVLVSFCSIVLWETIRYFNRKFR